VKIGTPIEATGQLCYEPEALSHAGKTFILSLLLKNIYTLTKFIDATYYR
jgi:hypothetical protein